MKPRTIKLRNKKTGQVVSVKGKIYIDIDSENRPEEGFKTLREFTETWEDYTPAEPLIKDEKIRTLAELGGEEEE